VLGTFATRLASDESKNLEHRSRHGSQTSGVKSLHRFGAESQEIREPTQARLDTPHENPFHHLHRYLFRHFTIAALFIMARKTSARSGVDSSKENTCHVLDRCAKSRRVVTCF